MAETLVGASLPQSVQSWLTDMEQADLVAASIGRQMVKMPALAPVERETVTMALKSLSELLAPSRNRGTELEQVVTKLFAAFNVYTGDQAKLRAQVLVWAEELEEFPLYAIRKAYKYAVRTGDKLPVLSAFISEVRYAIGANVIVRKRWLERLLRESQ